MHKSVTFASVDLPALSVLEPEPTLPRSTYETRWDRTRSRMREQGISSLVVYADREHPAGALYLTGFDPRFEEAVVVLHQTGSPVVIAGNESLSMVADKGLGLRGVLSQSLSLPGQKRQTQRRLSDAFREAGLDTSAAVGLVGWRTIPAADLAGDRPAFAVPHFVLQELREVVGDGIDDAGGGIVDASDILGGNSGERATNDVHQLALNEHRATRASVNVWNALEALRPGISELDLSVAMRLTGLPLSAHVMLATGSESVNGLYSPGDRVIERGDRLSTAVGLQGGLASRAGLVADADDVDAEHRSFVAGYWRAVAHWYESLSLGASTGEIAETTTAVLRFAGIEPLLNPGHLQHIDEWLDSPFVIGSTHQVHSGMSLQADIIPVGAHAGLFANTEDALAIADATLRAEFAALYPAAWARIQGRRTWMRSNLGIALDECVLPFCDRQAALPVGLLTPDVVATLR